MSIIRLNSGTWIRLRRIISCLKGILALICCILLFSCAGISGAGTRAEEEPTPLRIYPARWYKDHAAACSLTFDDGTLDQYAVAAPELDKRGIRGTFFVVTGFVDRGAWQDGPFLRRLFSWEQARDLAWRGHEVASHTVHHIDLAANPAEAAEELSRSRERLMDELPWVPAVSLGWPYWRSSEEAVALAEKLYIAARAGGVKAGPEDWFYGGVNGGSPENIYRIGARGILSSDGEAELRPILEEVYSRGGWLIPNFHGVDDGTIDSSALGWEALSLEVFRRILDSLKEQDIWFAPFGEAARYVMQRDALVLETARAGRVISVDYSSALDPGIYNQRLTLVVEIGQNFRIKRVDETETGRPLAFTRQAEGKVVDRYLIDLPPGEGELRILADPHR
ncbi:hypothetical protein B4O97_02625 [Marispirochaeta aestuarii]|uniref:NodB homology domain-containing protein n=1 Tax=Marispirochaeta aestuarii TaxID=1963862 RepID=A0A1Y1S3F0_9SPIO|nr:polysaccharide deacetylase family protein [Marispirochaeta aestuarii]ORC37911.1 hypothetical protein B4O97_02625 [Marispirochaeta aestuarii]